MTTYTTKATVPTFLRDKSNGFLLPEWLRAPDGAPSQSRKLFVPVSYAMQAIHYAAEVDGILLRTTGRYRGYDRQMALFLERYSPTEISGRPTKRWNGQTYWQKPGVAMAATPGTSNHGLGLADDVAEEDSTPPDTTPESLGWGDIAWLDANQAAYGFGLETVKEQWHRHWVGGDELSQVVVDVLHANGVTVPDLTSYGFTVPAPTPPSGEDDMFSDEDRALLAAAAEPLSDGDVDRIVAKLAPEVDRRLVGQFEQHRTWLGAKFDGTLNRVKALADGLLPKP